jgi:hypothetical protein
MHELASRCYLMTTPILIIPYQVGCICWYPSEICTDTNEQVKTAFYKLCYFYFNERSSLLCYEKVRMNRFSLSSRFQKTVIFISTWDFTDEKENIGLSKLHPSSPIRIIQYRFLFVEEGLLYSDIPSEQGRSFRNNRGVIHSYSPLTLKEQLVWERRG